MQVVKVRKAMDGTAPSILASQQAPSETLAVSQSGISRHLAKASVKFRRRFNLWASTQASNLPVMQQTQAVTQHRSAPRTVSAHVPQSAPSSSCLKVKEGRTRLQCPSRAMAIPRPIKMGWVANRKTFTTGSVRTA